MPIYEYHCGKCKHDFEELVFSRKASVACPECGHKKVKRKLSTFAMSGTGKASGSGGSSCGSCTASSCRGCSSGS